MEANELRIGNWVKDHGESGEHYQVREIGEDMFSAGPMTVYSAGMDYEYGIPLTEEWLLKFGFTQRIAFGNIKMDEFEFKNEVFNLIVIGPIQSEMIYQIGFNFKTACPFFIKYVHQLQNLYFALTGEKLPTKS